MSKFFCFVLLLLSNSIHAQVQLTSFYFVAGDTVLTSESEQKIIKLDNEQLTDKLQIIELDVFSNSSTSRSRNKAIANSKVDYFLNRLRLSSEDITVINYGGKQIPVVFEPLNWNRIDIYYNLSPIPEYNLQPIPDLLAEVILPDPILDTLTETVPVIPEPIEIVRNIPLVTPIKFEGGKTRIKEESLEYVHYLFTIMDDNPEITAHIRGHVCCGRNRRVSRKRAKNVYKSLIEKGINADRMTYQGYSNALPIVFPERTKMDRETNRRVDIIFK